MESLVLIKTIEKVGLHFVAGFASGCIGTWAFCQRLSSPKIKQLEDRCVQLRAEIKKSDENCDKKLTQLKNEHQINLESYQKIMQSQIDSLMQRISNLENANQSERARLVDAVLSSANKEK